MGLGFGGRDDLVEEEEFGLVGFGVGFAEGDLFLFFVDLEDGFERGRGGVFGLGGEGKRADAQEDFDGLLLHGHGWVGWKWNRIL